MAGWLKKLLSSSNTSRSKHQTASDDLAPLTDSDFEFLLDQLVQGLAHGWQADRVEVFISDLGSRGKPKAWEAWLESFSTRILAQSPEQQQRQLGTRLIYISDAFKASPKLQRLSAAFAKTGQQLVTGRAEGILNLIWEYDGNDSMSATIPVESTEITPEVPVISPAPATDPAADTTKIQATASAESSAATVIQSEPTSPEPEATQPTAAALEDLFNQGLAKADAGDFIGAIADWDQVLKINDQIPQVWHNRGSAFGCLGEFEAALGCFDKAIEILPSGVVAWKDRSYALMKLERWEEALESWNHTVELRDDVAEAWYQRGCTLEQLRKFDNAQINYRRALSIEPDFEQARQRLEVIQQALPSSNPDPWSE
ncbi:MAG: tetratricopeptide repeat protein [Limnothrix sp.]